MRAYHSPLLIFFSVSSIVSMRLSSRDLLGWQWAMFHYVSRNHWHKSVCWLHARLGLPVVPRPGDWVSFIIIWKSQIFPECQSETADSIHVNSHCLSKMSQPNKFEIYRTSKECCSEHFPGSTSCIQDSIDSHPRFPWPIHFPGMSNYRPIGPPNAANNWGTDASHTVQWFPDLINKQNCVRGRNYEHWMQTDGFAGLYLFDNSTNCCKKW